MEYNNNLVLNLANTHCPHLIPVDVHVDHCMSLLELVPLQNTSASSASDWYHHIIHMAPIIIHIIILNAKMNLCCRKLDSDKNCRKLTKTTKQCIDNSYTSVEAFTIYNVGMFPVHPPR